MRYVYLVFAFVCVLTVSVMGFRGSKSTKPPLEVFPDMDRQAKYKPQAASPLFADGRTDRPLPAGAVSRDDLRDDDHLFRGKDAKGQWATTFPAAVTVDAQLLEHGRERYSIYCYPCHGALGDGKGIVTEYGWGGPANFHSDNLRKMADGEIFNTITNGKNTMFPYADKLTPKDRWAVVAYVRALQRAQLGTAADVPPANKSELGLK
jgi:mono/diheme cytochrome c family protein